MGEKEGEEKVKLKKNTLMGYAHVSIPPEEWKYGLQTHTKFFLKLNNIFKWERNIMHCLLSQCNQPAF